MNALEVDSITKVVGQRIILDDISFKVGKSRIHGLLGPNGAGKTTTMRILSGLSNPARGSVRLDGIDIKNYRENLFQKIGFLIEEPPLYRDMLVHDYLKFAARLRKVPAEQLEARLDYCYQELDLGQVKNRLIENLSRGFKQRVGIAQAIIHNPEIVILDEPNLGLDPKSMSEIRDLIQQLRGNHTVIVSSHLLHEMSLVCDDITIISQGKILQSGELKKLQRSLKASQSFTLKMVQQNLDFETLLRKDSRILDFSMLKKKESCEYHITAESMSELRPDIVTMAVGVNAQIIGLEKDFFNLEDYFLKVTESHD